MDRLEWIAVALGLANVALLVRRSIWNYPFGMAMVALYAAIFYRARLYSEAGLQGFFFVMQGCGWWLWAGHRISRRGREGPVTVRRLGIRQRLGWITITAALSLSLGWAMHRFTNAALPFVDSAVTGASIAAQILLSFRWIENWVWWIVIDVVSIGLYVNRSLDLTAGLYALFLALSVAGLRQWINAARMPPSPMPTP